MSGSIPPTSIASDPTITSLMGKITNLVSNLTTSLADKLLNRPGTTGYVEIRNNELTQKLAKARNNYTKAPYELSLAEKNMFEYNGGDTANGEAVYNMTIIDRFATTAAELRRNSIEKQQEFMANITESLKQYQAQKLFAARTVELLQVRKKENIDLTKKLEMYDRILQTSERKVMYQIKDTSSLFTYRRAMIFLYYAAIICYIIFSNFIPEKLYVDKTIWLMIIIACIIPIILNILIKWIFIIGDVLVFWFKGRPHKDVYADLKGDTP